MLKILYGYHYHEHPLDMAVVQEVYLSRIRALGYDVRAFPMTLRPRGPKENWRDLDRKWRTGDRELLKKYEELGEALTGCDVFLNYGAINVHPAFLEQLPVLKVMAHFDDPENAEQVSRPLAPHYDLCLVGNIAELATYRAWGARRVAFWPMGFRQDDYDPALTADMILNGERDVDLTILCEREHVWRRARLDAVAAAFPHGRYHGIGWPAGFLRDEERVPLLQRTKLGVNIHNSTGPINVRTYALPANGVLQICDNKAHLNGIFEIGKEVAGFDNINEAIDLARYFLAHDDERRTVAAAGFLRATRDYHEAAVWERAMTEIRSLLASRSAAGSFASLPIILRTQRQKTRFARGVWHVAGPIHRGLKQWRKRFASLRRRFQKEA